MRRIQPEFGEHIFIEKLNSIGDYILVTMEEPWEILKKNLTNLPKAVIYNRDMGIKNLEQIEKTRKLNVGYVVGFGGGTSCDTAKYLSWKWEIPLVISPSIISVDAWLCRSIAVRINHNVKYIGDVKTEQYLVDFSLIKSAPKFLNWAGIADVISIATALGDWIIARDTFGEKFDQNIFNSAQQIVNELISQVNDIKDVNNNGIKALVKGQVDEVILCEKWGNARPEEGGEHFLAYCLENITRGHYIHGNLIALNVLVVLKLQRDKAVFDYHKLREFFDKLGIIYSPKKQKIKRNDYKNALESVQEFVKQENLANSMWSLEKVFDEQGDYSMHGILDWIYSF